MDYESTLEYLFKQLPMYQKEGKVAYKKDLSNTLALCNLLNQPQKRFKSIHIAGTNGKGSTAHMISSVFQEAGFKTGLYTSPHLKDFRERIRINGEMVSKDRVINFVDNYKSDFEKIQPSFFEWTVAFAFDVLAHEKVDIAIIETGLGGRLDSTNVISPELSVITNIGLDHTQFLGDTLELIAKEKAGIIKEETPVVVVNTSSQKQVFKTIANAKNAPLHLTESLNRAPSLQSDLKGSYQKENIKGVYHTWFILRKMGWKISFPQLENGLKNVVKNTGLRGRWETLSKSPLIIAETAHNKEGLTIALNQLMQLEHDTIYFVLGFVNDKEIDQLLSLFPYDAKYYFCQANVPRALAVEELDQKAQKHQLFGKTFQNVQEAFQAAKSSAGVNDIIYVGGSNFVVAEVL